MGKNRLLFCGLLILFCSHGGVSGGYLDKRACIYTYAIGELGVREATGRNDGFAVEKYLATTGLNKGYAWCAAYVNWMHVNCGVKTPDDPAWSPSWFTDHVIYHRGVMVSGGAGYQRPDRGDVFGIYFRNKKRIAHVGLIHEWLAGSRFKTIEGNTNEAGSREGDGVYIKYRLKSQIYKAARWR